MSDIIMRGIPPVGVGPYRDVDKWAEQLAKWSAERQREWELSGLLDRELGLEPEPEIGRDVFVAACADLRSRGVDPDTADMETMRAALVRCSA
jgi:hypothetical protein